MIKQIFCDLFYSFRLFFFFSWSKQWFIGFSSLHGKNIRFKKKKKFYPKRNFISINLYCNSFLGLKGRNHLFRYWTFSDLSLSFYGEKSAGQGSWYNVQGRKGKGKKSTIFFSMEFPCTISTQQLIGNIT